jgi:hypothetical protein
MPPARSPLVSTLWAALALTAAASPATGGVWFDIGGGQPVTVYSNLSVRSFEIYAPFAFGPFPPGSLVYADMTVVPCEQLGESGQICGETRFIRGFRILFSGVSCGCHGSLVVPTQLHFDYDPATVQAAGAQEASLKLFFRDEFTTNWTLMPIVLLDTEAKEIVATWEGNVLGLREFAIMTHDITPVAADTWGRLKTLYRR